MRIIILFIFSLLHWHACAQFYPVQSTPQLVPPYSVYLGDYATPGNEKLRVILVQRDLTQPSYQLRLVMSVELNGRIVMRTARTYNPPPIHLNPGIPTVISGGELAPYLDSRNIDFIGYSKEQYERTKALPEGSYQIIFTAYDYRRQDVQVSNGGGTFYYLAKSEPPLINYPACGSKVAMRTPQQIVFSWLSRNTSSPNSVADTEYQLELFETRPAGRNPNDIVLSTQPVFKTLLSTAQYVYTPADPLLLENMVYVWRVRAINRSGKDAFRNNGYSEVCTFTYGGSDADFNIGVVKNFRAQAETERMARLWWDAGDFDAYRVSYRKAGKDFEWFTSTIAASQLKEDGKTTGEIKLYDLEPDTEYEARVQGKRKGYFGNYTDIVKFSTPPHKVAQCGDQPAEFDSDLGKPFLSAIKGSIVEAHGIAVTLLEVINLGDGWYRGIGHMSVSHLGGAAFHVQFDRIYIRDDHKVVRGRMDVVSESITSVVQQQIANAAVKGKLQIQQQNRDKWTGTVFYDKVISYDITIDTITTEGVGYLTVTDREGNVTTNAEVAQILLASPDKAIIIQDRNVDQYIVQKDKTTGLTKVTKVEGGGLQPGNSIDGVSISANERKLFAEILERFENQIVSVLTPARQPAFPRGAGPMADIFDTPAVPACMPEDQDQLHAIKEYIARARVDDKKLNALITAVYKNESDKQFITSLIKATKLNDNQKFQDVLSAENLGKTETLLCSSVLEQAKEYIATLWWNAPYWERGAKILKEHFEDQGFYEDVTVVCTGNECKTVGTIKISEDASARVEVTFNNKITDAATWAILTEHGVDFWEGRTVTLESFKERFWNYMAMKDDRLYEGKGVESKILEIVADVFMAAPGTIEGWYTGKHWRTGEELALWEHILGVFDVIPAEAFAKAGVTALIVKIGSKVIDISKFSAPVKSFIVTAYKSGFSLLIKSKDEIIVYAGVGKKQIGRLVNGVLQDLYWKYGGERILAKLANVKYFDDDTKRVVEGSLEIVEEGSEADVRVSKNVVKLSDQIDNTLARLKGKAKYSLNNTGQYSRVGGHHPVAKKAFEGDLAYDYQKAFSVATSELDKISGIDKVHTFITGQQNKLYTAWKKANPNASLTIDIMADIEILAMKNAGVPEDFSIGWIVKALEDLKAQGVTEIKNIPWNGPNIK